MITIDLLKYHEKSIPELAKIWHQVLGSLWVPHVSLEAVKERFINQLNNDQLPLTLVAFDPTIPDYYQALGY